MPQSKDSKRQELEQIFSSTGFNFDEFDPAKFIVACHKLMKKGEIIISESVTDPNGQNSRVRITNKDSRRYLVVYNNGSLSVT